MALTKIMRKGQVVIPKDVREKVRFAEGDRVFIEAKEGGLILIRKLPSWREARGSWREDFEGVTVGELVKDLDEAERRGEGELMRLAGLPALTVHRGHS